MTMFDNLGKKMGNLAQTAAKKSGELVEITKINFNISSEEDKIKDLFCEIGKSFYEMYIENPDASGRFSEQCAKIKQYKDNIKVLKEKINEIKNITLCTSCGNEVDKSNSFCNKCGAKVQAEPAASTANEDNTLKCPSCNAKIEASTVFCSSCGTKVK